MIERMTSKIAQVTIRVTGVWDDGEDNNNHHTRFRLGGQRR